MLISDLTVEVRNSSLARVGQILESDLIGSEFVPRFNNVGGWKIVLRASHPLADTLRAPGSGVIVTLSDGTVLLSGPTRSAKITRTSNDPSGVWEILGVDDSVILGERLAYPTPATADVTAQTADYDTRTDNVETVIKGFVTDNIGPSAPVDRKIPALVVEADSARGSVVTGKARFDKLGELFTALAATDGLGFTVDQNGDDLVFRVYEPTDRSAYIRMDVDNERLSKSEYAYTNPSATRVIVAGQGSGVDRTFVEVSTTESEGAESEWATRVEVFKDQRNTDDPTELTQAGAEVLADGGFTKKSVSVSPSDDQTMRYGTDWGLGDKVTVVVGSDEVAQVVTEVAIVVTSDGVKVGATVGNPAVAAVADTESTLIAAASDQEARISNLERNEPATSSGGGAPAAHASTHASGGTDAVTLAQSQVTDLTTDLAAKAPIADPTFTGTATTPVIRVTSTGDASLTSTTHGIQVGDTASTNLIIDNNEIITRSNGAASGLIINATGGDVSLGATTSTVNISGRINGTHYPYAVAAGKVNLSGTSARTQSVTVTFPSGRFSSAPVVTAVCSAGAAAVSLNAVVGSVTATNFILYGYQVDTGNWAGPYQFSWTAIEM